MSKEEKEKEKESFEEWRKSIPLLAYNSNSDYKHIAGIAWNHQQKKLDKANERIKELESFIGEMNEYLNYSCATNIMCNSQFHRKMKQHIGESDE